MSQSGAPDPSPGPPPDKREYARSENAAWNITGYLLAGPIAWGGIGWLIDRWLGTEAFLPIGLTLGLGLSIYMVWVRYGRS
jgi:F0F1-type ATP synthase assembly protein I